jgi:hypothetical protein
MAATPRDKALLAGATVLVAASAGFFGWLIQRGEAPFAAVVAELSAQPYTAAVKEASVAKVDPWSNPAAQSRGRDWIYDAFTPPEIFYNSRSKQFTVKPPSSLAEGEPEEAFGVELVSVRPEVFRLQLIGYAGSEGAWRGTFENFSSGEVFLATAGQRVPKLGLVIQSLDVRPQKIAVGEGGSSLQRVAVAVVRDERSGAETTLNHRERRFTGTVSAFVAATGDRAPREVRAGDVFKVGEASYRVERVEANPPSIEITKEAASLAQPDKRTLLPRDPEDKPDGAGS